MLRSFGAFLFCLIFLFGCHQEPGAVKPKVPRAPTGQESPNPKNLPKKPATPPQEEKKEPNTEFKKLHYVIYEKGRLKWDIRAERAKIFGGNRVFLEDLKACSHPQKGLCITSKEGSYNPQEGSFTFRGEVFLRSRDQGSLKTSFLSYLPKKELLKTTAPVLIRKKGLLIRGEGFIYDLRSGVMKVLKRTEVRVDG